MIVVLLFVYLLFSSYILKNIDPSFSSVFDAFWFNLVSITSVGYGDITPVSNPGKVVAMFSIIFGIMFVSIFTAAMSAVYMEKSDEEHAEKIKKQLDEHVKQLESENEILNDRIDVLEKQNEHLNEKLNVVIDLLKKE